MFIQKIHLKNIKSYSDSTFEFQKGINFIHGQNGAGKSTIIEAIGFCLFNETLAGLGYDLKTFINQTAKSGSIKIWFQGNDQRGYCITRQIRQTAQKAWELEDLETGDLWEKKENIEPTLKKIFLLDSSEDLARLFREIIAVNQGQFTAPFLLSPGEREKKFNRLFGLESYNLAYSKSSKLENILKDKIQTKELKITDLKKFTFNLPQLKKELKENKNNHREHSSQLKKLQKESLKNEQELNNIKITQKQQEQVVQQIKLSEQKKLDQESNLQKLTTEITHSQQATTICKQNQAAFTAYQQINEQIEQQEQTLQELNKKENLFKSLDKEISVLENQIKTDSQNITQQENELKEKHSQLTTEQQQQQEIKLNLQKEQTKWQSKQQTIDKLNTVSQNFNKLIDSYFHQTETKINQQITQIKTKLQELQEHQSKIKDGVCFVCGTKNEQFDHNFGQEIKVLKQQLLTKQAELDKLLKEKSIQIDPSYFQEIATNLSELKEDNDLEINNWNTFNNLQLFQSKAEILEQKVSTWQKGIKKKNEDFIKKLAQNETILNKLEQEAILLKTEWQKVILQKDNISKLKEKYQQQKKEISKLQIQLKELTRLKEQINDLKKQQKENYSGFNLYQQNISLAQKSELLEKQLLIDQKHLKTTSAEISSLQKKLALLNQELFSFFTDNDILTTEQLHDNIAQLEQTLIGTKEEISSIKSILYTKEQEQIKLERQIDQGKETLVKIEDIKQEQQKIKQQQSLLNFIRNDVLKKTPGPLAQKYRDYISSLANKIYRQISNQAENLTWGKNFDVQLANNLYYKTFKQLSGGEQIATAFAIRLSLIKSFSNLQLGFFDEPTVNLDAKRRYNLAKIIPKIAGSFEQLFIISHDDSFDSITDQVIEVTK